MGEDGVALNIIAQKIMAFPLVVNEQFSKTCSIINSKKGASFMVYGYIRVSSDKQTVENQRFEINKFAQANNLNMSRIVAARQKPFHDHGNSEFVHVAGMQGLDN